MRSFGVPSARTWNGGHFEVLLLTQCSRRSHEVSNYAESAVNAEYTAGTLRSTSCSSQRRVLLGEDNAPRGFCVLIFMLHRHQGCGVPWHYVWIIVTKHNTMSGEWRRPL